MHVLFLLQFIKSQLCNSLSYCTGTSCSCPAGLNFRDITCVPLCPTGFLQNGSNCTQAYKSNLLLFSLSFYKYWNFSAQAIENFSLKTSELNSENIANPIFTKDRGFFFKRNSEIQSENSWLLSPEHTVNVVLRVVHDGVIFEIFDDSGYVLKIYAEKELLCFSILLTNDIVINSDSENVSYINSFEKFCINIIYNQWSIVSFITDQRINLFIIKSLKKTQISESSIFSVKGKDFLCQKTGLKSKIGEKTQGFLGFLYEMRLDNEEIINVLRFYKFIDCEFGEFFDYNSENCTLCSKSYEDILFLLNEKNISSKSGSQTGNSTENSTTTQNSTSSETLSELIAENFTEIALCTREEEYCYSSNCSACTGFIFGLCSSCFDNSSLPDCGLGFFSSSNCPDPLILIEKISICAYPSNLSKSNFSQSFLILNFENFEGNLSLFFNSGSNDSTFAPFNSPENDDPYPVKRRGFYFNGESFFYSSSFSLNLEFSISFWTWGTSDLSLNSSLWTSKDLNLRQDGVGKFCFFDGLSEYCEYSSTGCAQSKVWVFTSFTLKFDEITRTSLVTRLRNSLKEEVLSVPGHVFLNRPSTVWLGRGENNFTGFIYQIGIWDYPADVSSSFKKFCVGSALGCAIRREKEYFFNNITGNYQLCDKRCASGCVEWGRCGPCLEADCSTCSDFDSLCVEYGKSTCLDDLIITEKKHCCHFSCKECKGIYPFHCIQCHDDKDMAEGGCFESCPIGYVLKGESCTRSYKIGLDVTFNKLSNEFLDSVSLARFGENNENFYNFLENQPIPADGRGLFFNDSRKISSSFFVLPFNFMVTFFMKILKTGCIFEKGKMGFYLDSLGFVVGINNVTVQFESVIEEKWLKVVVGYITTFNDTNFVFVNFDGLYLDEPLNKVWLLDTLSEMSLGNNDSFTGFIYRVIIYTVSDISVNLDDLPETCSISNQIQCLSPCLIDEYFNITECSKCSGCQYGCYTDLHCNPCLSDHCLNCTDYKQPCTQCEKNYTLYKGKCGCQANFYLNKTTCSQCDFNCFDCSESSKFCIDCGPFSELVNNSCKCLKGFIHDKSLPSISFSCRCPNNSKIDESTNTSCICDSGYVKVNDSCEKCHDRCLTCKGTEYFQCLTCRVLFDNGICRDNCSLGFKSVENRCIQEKMPQGVFKLKFDQLQLPLNDQINQIGVEYGGKGRRLENSPSSVLFRGILFDGKSNYMKFPSPPLNVSLLSYEFSMSIWFYPLKNSDILLTQTQGNNISISLSFIDHKLIISIKISNLVYSLNSVLDIVINNWNNLVFGLKFSTYSTSFVMINDKQDNDQTISVFPFEEPISSVITIGKNYTDYYEGFIYSFTIYNEIPGQSSFNTEVNLCEDSSITSCLSSCNTSTFFDYESKTCFPCIEECTAGCRNNISCSQCQDPHCKICDSFQSQCKECEFNYELKPEGCVACGADFFYDRKEKKCKLCEFGTFIVNGKCIRCKTDQFFDKENRKCVKCLKLCSTCEGLYNCTTCISKAFLNEDSLCYCEKGYDPNNSCSYIQTYFSVRASVSSENEVHLIFSELLIYPLNKTNLNVTLDLTEAIYSFSIISNDHYLLILSLPEVVKSGTIVRIEIKGFLKSVNNSLLSQKTCQASLFPTKSSTLEELIKNAKALAQQGLSAGLSISIGTSALSFDPVSFFSFLSTAEIYYPISLFSCDLPEDLSAFLGSLRTQSMMPNLLAYGIEDTGSEIPSKFKRIGFSSSLLLVNTGVNLTVGAFFLAIMAVIKLLSFSQKIRPFLKKIRKMFEFGIFLKFWIQSFFEFLIGAIITLKYNNLSTGLERFDFFLGLVVLIFQFAGVFLLIFLIIRRTRVDEEGIEHFIISFGVIFDEFKSYGLSFWIFYLIYVMRRLFLVFFAVFLEEGIMQVMVCFCFSILLFIYVLATRCFKNPVSNFYVLVNETLAFITSVLLMLHLIGRNFSGEDTKKHVVRVVIAAWALNILYGVVVLGYKFGVKVVFKKKHAKVQDVNSLTIFEPQYGSKAETSNQNNLTVIENHFDIERSVSGKGSSSPDIMLPKEIMEVKHFPSPVDSPRAD